MTAPVAGAVHAGAAVFGLVLAADESSAAYRIGYVLGLVVPVAAIIGLVVWAVRRSGRRARANRAAAPVWTASQWTTPPAWYPDPSGAGGLRWWDGTAWTAHTRAEAAGPPPGAGGPPAPPASNA